MSKDLKDLYVKTDNFLGVGTKNNLASSTLTVKCKEIVLRDDKVSIIIDTEKELGINRFETININGVEFVRKEKTKTTEKEPKCELFLIRTAHIEKGKFGTLRQYFADEDKYIYCPVSELKYIISNTDDKSVIEWYKIVEAYRRKDMSLVKPEEVFRQ